MTIGDIIKTARKELNMTQEELAAAVGTTKATVSRWESGDIHKIKRPMISAMEKVLHLDPKIFFQREEVLFPDERDVINAYRRADDGTKSAVRKLLDIPEAKKDTESFAG
jgi:repressor LexA